ncbi:pyridoxal-phosphate dependent enzyme [Actinomycetes bacterium KLBMP 9797]
MRPVRPFVPRVPSPVVELVDDRLAAREVRVYLKRDDLIHPELPGNKWRKLKYNLAAAAEQGHRTLLTFGGAYSNHVRAVAAAGHYFGFATVGVIRGEEHLPLNPVLSYSVAREMRLVYLDRTAYRARRESSVIDGLRRQYGDFYLIPEGGSNALALRGCAELPGEIPFAFDHLCCAAGTGGTLAGLAIGLSGSERAAGLTGGQRGVGFSMAQRGVGFSGAQRAAGLGAGGRAIGFSALKGGGFLADEVRRLQRETGHVTDNWSIETGFHCGGYARRTAALDAFVEDFRERHGVALDWVYVAKMMYGVFALVRDGRFTPGSVVVAVVTGS